MMKKQKDSSVETMSSEELGEQVKDDQADLPLAAAKTLSEENRKKTLKDAVKPKNKRKKKKSTPNVAD